MLKLEDLELPRFQTCSFFPYSLNEQGGVVLLLCQKKDSKSDYYLGFGTSVKEQDPNIYYSAARSFIKKTQGLCVASEIDNL